MRDPPYPIETRAKARLYRYDYAHDDHVRLLACLRGLPCMVIVSSYDIDGFLEGLNTELAPWERDFGIDLTAAPADAGASRTWRFVTVGRPKDPVTVAGQEQAFAGFLQAADESGSTEVYHQGTDGRLWIGMLDQPRYWTFSQGLRSARHVAWNHIEFLMGNGDSARLQ